MPTTVYEARRRDERFALAWHDLEEGAVEVLEAEAYRQQQHSGAEEHTPEESPPL